MGLCTAGAQKYHNEDIIYRLLSPYLPNHSIETQNVPHVETMTADPEACPPSYEIFYESNVNPLLPNTYWKTPLFIMSCSYTYRLVYLYHVFSTWYVNITWAWKTEKSDWQCVHLYIHTNVYVYIYIAVTHEINILKWNVAHAMTDISPFSLYMGP